MSTLERYGFAWDGPVVRQSERTALYASALEKLVAAGEAYECACTRREQELVPPGPAGERVYPGTCRHGIPADRARRRQRAWRMRVDSDRRQHDDRIPRSSRRPRRAGPRARRRRFRRPAGGRVFCLPACRRGRRCAGGHHRRRARRRPRRIHAPSDLPAAAPRLPDAVVPARSRCRRRERHEAVERRRAPPRCPRIRLPPWPPRGGSSISPCRTARRHRPRWPNSGHTPRAHGHLPGCRRCRCSPRGQRSARDRPGRYN